MAELVAGMNGKSRKNLDKAIRERLPFRTSGALSGEVRQQTKYGTGQGRLRQDEYDMLKADLAHADQTFIVFSYETPIAWTRPNGELHVTPQKFSVTTTKHQSAIAGADAVAKLSLTV